MKRILISLAIASTLFAGSAMAQSSKFAAVWSDDAIALESTACASTEAEACGSLGPLDMNAGYTVTTIRAPQGKELLVGLSAQVGLFTSTEVKGKRGSVSTALAAAGGAVALLACPSDGSDCVMGKPGPVILNARIQEMAAILAGVIDTCTFDVELDVVEDKATGDATFNLSDCVVADEMISLALATLDASHFNFVFPDLPVSGDYNIVAQFMTVAGAEAYASCGDSEVYPHCIEGDGSATAISHAFIGKTMLTVQEVRAVKGSLTSMEISEF